jgi:hypothetical protein
MKKIISLSVMTSIMMAIGANANDNLKAELDALKVEVAGLKKVIKKAKLKKIKKQLGELRGLAKGDNLKFGVDFRTSYDSISYTHASGKKSINDTLFSNRLWLDMAYKPASNLSFHGRLSYSKIFGDTANHSQSNTNPGYADFDWVVNENSGDTSLNVKQVYFLYQSDTLFGAEVPVGASIGRRPGTDGLLANFREDSQRQSALAHTVNSEFDGFSVKFTLDKVVPMTGSWLKVCGGKGLTNAKPRFSFDGTDYSHDDNLHDDNNLLGVIYVPYDNGQYSVNINYAKSWNMIGFDYANLQGIMMGTSAPTFQTVGDMTFMTANVVVNGIGEYGESDFLDNTKLFLSYAQSETNPNGTADGMLGSLDKQTGHSWWLGANFPCLLTDGNWGIEYNKGSKYWRSMTYAEDTMIGSKVATRGDAWEIYYNKPIIDKKLSAQLRFTQINYDYTGSNMFFGAEGTPMTMNEAKMSGLDPIEKATDIRAYIRYQF